MVSAPAKLGGHFDLGPDPVKMCQLAAGALLFARGDVQPARRTLERNYNPEQVRESLRLPWNERPYFTPGFPLSLPLQSGVRIRSLSDQATGPFEIASAFPIRSDTGELAWFLGADKKGLVTLNTPRSQAIVGFSGATKEATENLALDLETPFSAVTLGALDAEPIARSGKLLLTACARIANANLQWNEKRTSLTDWGAAPTVIEPVTGRVLLRNLTGATRVSAQALDGGGQPLGPRQVAEKTDAGWRLSLGEPTTTWFVVQVER